MKLHSRQFETAVRRGVCQAVRNSPALKKAAKSVRRRKHYSLQIVLRPCLSLLLGGGIHTVYSLTTHLSAALGMITIWSLGFVFVQAQRFLNSVYLAPELQAFWLLPIEENRVFRIQLWKAFRGTLWLLFDFLCAFGAFSFHENFSSQLWFTAIPLAVITWAQTLALALLALIYIPRFPFQLASSAFFLIVFVSLVARSIIGNAAITVLSVASPTLNIVLPTGWAPSLFRSLLPNGPWEFGILSIPLAISLATLRSSLARLKLDYRFVEPIAPESHDLLPETEQNNAAAAPETPPRATSDDIENYIHSRAFLEPAPHEHSWLGQLLRKWLQPRQRVLIDFIFPNGLNLARSWRKIFRNLAITAVATVLAGRFVEPVLGWRLLAAGLFITACHVLFVLITTGRAFQKVFCSGVNIPMYAAYGVGFRELCGTLLKVSAVQMPFTAAYCVAAAMLAYTALDQPFVAGLELGLKLTVLIWFSRYVLIPFGFSSGTNDTSRIRLCSMLLIFFVVSFCTAFAGLGIASLYSRDPLIVLFLLACAAAVAYGFFRIYARFYHSKAFDLMNVPQQ